MLVIILSICGMLISCGIRIWIFLRKKRTTYPELYPELYTEEELNNINLIGTTLCAKDIYATYLTFDSVNNEK